ncbi:unnamed protein product [Amoebophrya sp. A25]|nr:unnamed protein product [Amoebophrya sp. A25]|eukprot:GSA25T00020343001.1
MTTTCFGSLCESICGGTSGGGSCSSSSSTRKLAGRGSFRDAVVDEIAELRRVNTSPSNEDTSNASLTIENLLLGQNPMRKLTEVYHAPERRLGAGAFGEVWRVRHRSTGTKRVVKKIKMQPNMDPEDLEFLAKELGVLLRLDHPNVVKCHDWFQEENGLFIVFELCEGGELVDFLNATDKREKPAIADVMSQIFAAVAYCHELNVIHRDLKLENCLLKSRDSESLVKIIDFGLCAVTRLQDAKLKQKLGTPFFLAPEVIDEKRNYGSGVDLWACGVIFYVLLTGHHPFFTRDCGAPGRIGQQRLFKRICSECPHQKPLKQLSGDARDLVSRLLHKDARQRPNAKLCLLHPYFKAVGGEGSGIRLQRSSLDGGAPLSSDESSEGGADENNISRKSKRDSFTQGTVARWAANARSFYRQEKFAKIFLLIAAHQAASKDLEEIQKAFLAADVDRSGELSREEVRAIFEGHCYNNAKPSTSSGGKGDKGEERSAMTDAEFTRLFDSMDSGKTGNISYTEWVASVFEKSLLEQEKTVRSAFEFFDLDGNGAIDRTELLSLLGGDAGEVDKTMKRLDTTKSGTVTYPEFSAFVKELTQEMTENPH